MILIRHNICRRRGGTQTLGYAYFQRAIDGGKIIAIDIDHSLHPELFPLDFDEFRKILNMFFGDNWVLDYSSSDLV